MAVVGRISQLWRYPVKSMGGESLDRCALGALGIPGDRGWAVRDERAGEIRGAKKLRDLLHCRARYLTEPSDATIPAAEITLPDGSRVHSDDPEAAVRLSDVVGRPVTLWSRQPATNLDHYRRAPFDNPDMIAELREVFGRTEDEPLPDLGQFPPELMTYVSPPGTYFDAFPLHVMTTASLAALAARTPGAHFDARRFRPNVVIETPPAVTGLVENDWCGKTLRIGAVRIDVQLPCVRCVMTTLPQADLPHEPSVLRTIVRDAAQNFGVYATVATSGNIRIGDEIDLV